MSGLFSVPETKVNTERGANEAGGGGGGGGGGGVVASWQRLLVFWSSRTPKHPRARVCVCVSVRVCALLFVEDIDFTRKSRRSRGDQKSELRGFIRFAAIVVSRFIDVSLLIKHFKFSRFFFLKLKFRLMSESGSSAVPRFSVCPGTSQVIASSGRGLRAPPRSREQGFVRRHRACAGEGVAVIFPHLHWDYTLTHTHRERARERERNHADYLVLRSRHVSTRPASGK